MLIYPTKSANFYFHHKKWSGNREKKLKNSKYLLKKVLGGGGFGVTYKIIEQFSNISKIQSTLSTQDQKIKLTESQISDAKYQFDILTVNERGEEIKREQNKVGYFTEDLGNGVEMDMVAIPGGTFMMGTEDEEIERLEKKYDWCDFRREKPQHKVTVPSFYMGKFPVTQEQWKAVAQLPQVERKLEPEPSSYKGNNQLPVEFVSWEEVVEFCNRLSKATGKEYRLPAEAEWEYACRAETNTLFNFGETITSELANYKGYLVYANEPKGEYREKTTTVGSFAPNAFGLYDMHGNVWEWCQDNWHGNYKNAPNNGSAWLSKKSSIRVIRGGSWYCNPIFCRSAYRSSSRCDNRDDLIGFRVVCVAPKTPKTFAL